jgi:uncharacterized membrane protein YphA (DoxX/SURF4 family)
VPGWKVGASHIAAVLAAIPFLVAGVWKITDPHGAAVRLTQALVPANLALAGTICFGIAELFGAVLILIPRFRRWGAWVISLLLVAFMVYIGIYYTRLTGEDCNCFPWIKRVVGPGFFVSDGLMLLFAVLAGVWARPSRGVRSAAVILAAVAVFAGASFGVNAVRERSIKVPAMIDVEGKPFALRSGRVLIYFFNPECMHCEEAARAMTKYGWKDVTLIATPSEQPGLARDFLRVSGFRAKLTNDTARLRQAFPFTSVPFAVAIENGGVKAELRYFDDTQPEKTLRQIGFVK